MKLAKRSASLAMRISTDPSQSGAGFFRVTQKNGRRWSAADAYLRPALRRGNLTVWTGIQVTRVLIENGRALGVEYLQKGSGPPGARGA